MAALTTTGIAKKGKGSKIHSTDSGRLQDEYELIDRKFYGNCEILPYYLDQDAVEEELEREMNFIKNF